MEFSIFTTDYKLFSCGLSKSMVLYLFIEKKAAENCPIIRDSEGLDMNFNEFLSFYAPEFI